MILYDLQVLYSLKLLTIFTDEYIWKTSLRFKNK